MKRDELRRAPRRAALLLAAAWVALGAIPFTAVVALGQDAPTAEDELDRWRPRIDLAIGLHNQTVKVTGGSTLGASGRGSRAILTSLFGVNGSLSSPALVPDLGKPRLYVRGGYKFPVAEEPRLLDEDTVVRSSEFLLDPTLCGTNRTPGTASCEHNVRNDLQIQGIWNFGAGVEFRLPIEIQAFDLAIGAEYLGEKIQYTGAVTRIDRGFAPGGGNGQILGTVTLPRAVRSEYLHTLGPRAALSTHVSDLGPFAFHFYVETIFYFYVTEYDSSLGAESGAESSSFRVRSKEPFITQAAGGLMVVWR